MARRYSSDEIIKVLKHEGFVFVSQRGSHAKYAREYEGRRIVIVPMGKRQIPVGTFQSILRQSGLTKQDFER